LVLEATREVADTASAITSHVWHLANVIVHVSAGEQENSDQADCSPEIAILHNWKEVWSTDSKQGD